MILLRILISWLSILFLTSLAQAAPVCGEITTSVPWKFCFEPSSAKNIKKLVIYFHGGGLSEQSLFAPDSYGDYIRQYAQVHQLDRPHVVSISFGPMWLLTKKNSLPDSGLLEIFKTEILP